MNMNQYNAMMNRLGLNNVEAARWLGIDLKTARNYRNGHRTVPHHLARLLRMVEHDGLTADQATAVWGKE